MSQIIAMSVQKDEGRQMDIGKKNGDDNETFYSSSLSHLFVDRNQTIDENNNNNIYSPSTAVPTQPAPTQPSIEA